MKRKKCDDCIVGYWEDSSDMSFYYESDDIDDYANDEEVHKFNYCPICGRKL